MSSTTSPIRARIRALSAILLSGLIAWACTDGQGVTSGGLAVPLELVPSFQVDPSLFDTPPIDNIRMTAFNAVTDDVVGSVDTAVDPAAEEWLLELSVETAGENIDVVVEAELLSGGEVIWSGRAGPFMVQPGIASAAQVIEIYRGPLDNLDVTGVAIVEPPTQILVSNTAQLSAEVTLEAGSDSEPIVFWATDSEALATVAAVGGLTTTLTAVAVGTVEVFAGAGTESDQFTLEVLPRVSSVVVSPDPVLLDGVGAETQMTAVVTDGFGDPDPAAPVSWSSSDETVAMVDPDGLVVSVGVGTADVIATSFGVTGSAQVTVQGADLVPAAFSIVVDGQGVIEDLAAVEFQVDVENIGAVIAEASTVEVRILDDATSQEAHPPLTFAVPQLAPSEVFSISEVGGQQIQPGALPAALFFEVTVDAQDDVVESDETNNDDADGPYDVGGPQAGTRTWVGGATGSESDWGTATNWSPASVPTPADDVVIPVTANDPVLPSSQLVASLLVQTGATLDGGGFTLVVTGDIVAEGDVTNTAMDATGIGGELRGNLASLVVSGPRSLTGDLFLDGELTLTESLVVGTNSLDVPNGSISIFGADGLLVMTDATGLVTIGGDANFSGADHEGSLTAGALVIGGDLSSTAGSFAASGTHNTQFTGDLGQSVQFELPSASEGRFAFVSFGATTETTLLSDAFVLGQANVQTTLVVPASRTIDIGDAIFLQSGSTLNVDGTVIAAAGCTNLGGTIIGSGTHPCAPPQFSKVWVGGSVDGPTEWGNQANWVPAGAPGGTDDVLVDVATNQPVLLGDATVGDLVVGDQSTVDLGGSTLTVLGDLDAGTGGLTNGLVDLAGGGTVQGSVDDVMVSADYTASGPFDVGGNLTVEQDFNAGGQLNTIAGDLLVTGVTARLIMNTVGGVVDVVGSATFDGANHSGWLSQGILEVGGDFTVTNRSGLGFVGSVNHLVVLDGTVATTVDFGTPSTTNQRFQHLTFENTAPVTLLTDVVAGGLVFVTPGSQIFDGGDVRVFIAGGLVDDDAAMLPNEIHLWGDVSVLPPVIARSLIVEAAMTLPNSTSVTGSVSVLSDFTVGPNMLTVSGNLDILGAGTELRMTDALGVVDVEGDALFDGGSHSGWLTNGEIRVGGDFTAANTNTSLSFVGSGSHEVILDGSALQTINFAAGATGTQRFATLTFATGTTSTLATNIIADHIDVQGTATVDASDDEVHVRLSYTDAAEGLTMAQLNITGDLTAIPPTLTTNVVVDGAMALPSSTAITGDVTVNRDLTIGPHTLAVVGDFTTLGIGTELRMLDPAGIVDVDGNVLFDGGSTSGWLTNGEFRVAGDFTAQATNSTLSFVGTGSHEVIFDGGAPQTVTFSGPGTTAQRLMNATFATGTTTTLASDIVVDGTLDVQGTATVDASDDIVSIRGAYIDPAEGMTASQITVTGDLTDIPATLTTNIVVDGAFALPNSTTITGDVTVNADLTIGPNAMSVSGDFVTAGVGTELRMLDPASILDVDGDFALDGGSTSGWLTNGEIRVAGAFTAGSTNTALSFVATGSHEVIFDGAGPQTINFTAPGTTTQRFFHLTFETGSSTTLATDMVVDGTLDVQGTATVDASDDIVSIRGAYSDPAEGMSVMQITTTGDLTAIPATLTTDIVVDGALVIPNSTTITGNVTVNADLTISTNMMTVTGGFSTGGVGTELRMLDATSILDIDGDVLIDGGSTSGWLTNGELRIGGDLTVLATNSGLSFVGTGAHEVIFDGVGPQVITFSAPGTTTQRFSDATFATGTVSVLASDMVVDGTLDVQGAATIDASDDVVSIGGAYIDAAEGMSVLQINTTGDLTEIPATLSTDIFVNAALILPNSVTLTGSLTANADLTIGVNTLTVSGDFSSLGVGTELRMADPLSFLDVSGDVLFDGGNTSGWLTNGEIQVAGDFESAATNSALSFVATGSHTVRFIDGNPTQTITFASPGPTSSRFENLIHENFAGTVNLATTAVVAGTLIADDVAFANSGALGAVTLDVRGLLDVVFTEFDGLPLSLTSTSGPAAHTLEDVTFTGMAGTETQLFLRMPGGGVFLGWNLIFTDPPTTGLYASVESSNATPWSLDMLNPSPGSVSAVEIADDGVATIEWPAP